MTATRKHAGHLSTNKDLNELIRKATEAGWSAEKTRNNHIKLTTPEGAPVFCSQAPKDRRALENIRKEMERACPGWDNPAKSATSAMAAIATAKKKPPREAMNEAGKKPAPKSEPTRKANRPAAGLR